MNDLKIISEEYYRNNFMEADGFSIDDMTPDVRELYFVMYSFYRQMLLRFLMKKTNIVQMDQNLKDSPLQFLAVSEEEKDAYQDLSSPLSYLYLRNDIHLENLTNEERTFLTQRIAHQQYHLDTEMEEMIEKSYQRVIFRQLKHTDTTYSIHYGPLRPKFMAPNGSLVIGVRYNEFDFNGQSDDEWDENHERQQAYIKSLKIQIQKNIEETLQCPTTVIQYDDFSIKKKTNSVYVK